MTAWHHAVTHAGSIHISDAQCKILCMQNKHCLDLGRSCTMQSYELSLWCEHIIIMLKYEGFVLIIFNNFNYYRLSGRGHTVYTGVVVKGVDKMVKFTEKTNVFFGKMDEEQIRGYIATGEPM